MVLESNPLLGEYEAHHNALLLICVTSTPVICLLQMEAYSKIRIVLEHAMAYTGIRRQCTAMHVRMAAAREYLHPVRCACRDFLPMCSRFLQHEERR